MNNRGKAFCWTVCCLALVAQGGDWIEKRGPLDRLGVHHVGFVVRIVDHEGIPVDTTVLIVEMEPGWSGRMLNLAIAERVLTAGPNSADGPESRVDTRGGWGKNRIGRCA